MHNRDVESVIMSKGFPYERSLWSAAGDAQLRFQESGLESEYDVIVVGGGIAGAVALATLARAGVKSLLLEAYKLGSGATGRGGGFIVPSLPASRPGSVIERLGERGERIIAAVAGSADLVFRLIRELGLDCDAGQNGWFHPTTSSRKLEELAHDAKLWNRFGGQVRLLNGEETRRQAGVDGYVGSLVASSGGTIHPVRFVHALSGAAIQRGADIREHTPVLSMERKDRKWHVRTPRSVIRSDSVLVCTNGQSMNLAPELFGSLVPALICQTASRPIDESLRSHLLGQGACLSDTRANLFTYRFDAQWRLISGAFASFLPGHGARIAHRIASRLQSMLHLPCKIDQEFVWFGKASVSQDFLPRAMEIGPGAYAFSACNGRGLALSSLVAFEMATAIHQNSMQSLSIPLARPAPYQRRAVASLATRLYPMYGRFADKFDLA